MQKIEILIWGRLKMRDPRKSDYSMMIVTLFIVVATIVIYGTLYLYFKFSGLGGWKCLI